MKYLELILRCLTALLRVIFPQHPPVPETTDATGAVPSPASPPLSPHAGDGGDAGGDRRLADALPPRRPPSSPPPRGGLAGYLRLHPPYSGVRRVPLEVLGLTNEEEGIQSRYYRTRTTRSTRTNADIINYQQNKSACSFSITTQTSIMGSGCDAPLPYRLLFHTTSFVLPQKTNKSSGVFSVDIDPPQALYTLFSHHPQYPPRITVGHT